MHICTYRSQPDTQTTSIGGGFGAWPGATPVTTPEVVTVAMELEPVDHVTVPPLIAAPF